MFALKQNNSEYYVPKTPYTMDEMRNGYITNKPERIGIWKHKKYVENIKRDLGLDNYTVIEYGTEKQ